MSTCRSKSNSCETSSSGSSYDVESYGGVKVKIGPDFDEQGNEGAKISVYDSFFKTAGTSLNIDWKLIAAHAFIESSWNATAKNSESSAYGLYQINDASWKDSGVSRTDDVGKQTEAYIKLMRKRMDNFKNAANADEQIALAIQSWHDGICFTGSYWSKRKYYDKNKNIGNKKESKTYLSKILAKYRTL